MIGYNRKLIEKFKQKIKNLLGTTKSIKINKNVCLQKPITWRLISWCELAFFVEHYREMLPQINSQGPLWHLPYLHVADESNMGAEMAELLRDTVEFVEEYCIEFIHPIRAL